MARIQGTTVSRSGFPQTARGSRPGSASANAGRRDSRSAPSSAGLPIACRRLAPGGFTQSLHCRDYGDKHPPPATRRSAPSVSGPLIRFLASASALAACLLAGWRSRRHGRRAHTGGPRLAPPILAFMAFAVGLVLIWLLCFGAMSLRIGVGGDERGGGRSALFQNRDEMRWTTYSHRPHKVGDIPASYYRAAYAAKRRERTPGQVMRER